MYKIYITRQDNWHTHLIFEIKDPEAEYRIMIFNFMGANDSHGWDNYNITFHSTTDRSALAKVFEILDALRDSNLHEIHPKFIFKTLNEKLGLLPALKATTTAPEIGLTLAEVDGLLTR